MKIFVFLALVAVASAHYGGGFREEKDHYGYQEKHGLYKKDHYGYEGEKVGYGKQVKHVEYDHHGKDHYGYQDKHDKYDHDEKAGYAKQVKHVEYDHRGNATEPI